MNGTWVCVGARRALPSLGACAESAETSDARRLTGGRGTARRALLERQNATGDLAFGQHIERAVDLLQREPTADELVQIELARLVEVQQTGEVDLGPGAPVQGAPMTVFS